ncbi:MAG: AAA family ATPase [Limisphaerales bacterium]
MGIESPIVKSGAFVVSQFRELRERLLSRAPRPPGPAITITHQTGSGTREIAEKLAQTLQHTEPGGSYAWTVFDRQLVETALEEHHLPKALAKRMPEDKRSYIDDVMDDLFGLRPPSWVLVPQVVETMLRLAVAGHAILIGRGAAVVTQRLPDVFHVRLIGSLPKRIQRVQKLHNLTFEAAAEFVEKEDRGRERYVKANFHTRIDDDLLYHLVVNTDRISHADAVALIAEGAQRCFYSESGATLHPGLLEAGTI